MYNSKKKFYNVVNTINRNQFFIESEDYPLYEELIRQNHVLIGGTTGSGKSTVLDGIIYTICSYPVTSKLFSIIDLKRISILHWKNVPHCKGYATTPEDALQMIEEFCEVMDNRYKRMEQEMTNQYYGTDLYLIIDEAADLLDNPNIDKKLSNNIKGLLSHICRLGRACKCHVIYCSQQVARSVIPSSIQANCDALLGLRCRSKMESRMIVGQGGCECLPMYGEGYLYTPKYKEPEKVTIPKVPTGSINAMLHFYRTSR